MRIFAVPTRQITVHASHGVVMDFLPRMARTDGIRVNIARIEAGGTIGEHRAPVRQIFAIVDGRGEVAAGGGSRRQIEAGQVAVWEPGEMHQSWASVDMLVAIVETEGEIELDEQFVEVHE